MMRSFPSILELLGYSDGSKPLGDGPRSDAWHDALLAGLGIDANNGQAAPGGISLDGPVVTDTVLQPGYRDTGQYGNKFNGHVDSDGVVTAGFEGSGQDLLFTFKGYDIDYWGEVQVLLNGVSLGMLDTGINNGLSSYQFLITAAQQQAGTNTISFVQTGNPNYAWGVTDLLLETTGPAMNLDIGVTETGSYGNKFNGTGDANGVVAATFTSTGEHLVLTLDGFDIDAPNEVQVLLNGNSIGYLDGGVDNGLSSHEFFISAAQQQPGQNFISFVQTGNVNYAWGVTNILLDVVPPDPVVPLALGVIETGTYGNNFNGSVDLDGVVEASFDNAGQDLLLTFDGYDIDFTGELEVLLNGASLGFAEAGINNGLSSYQFLITAAQQQAGGNVISFLQTGSPTYVWGVTNMLLEPAGPAMTLQMGVTETGSYGNNFNGTSDGDGIVGATFTSTGQNLMLSLDGFDIDAPEEVEVLLNGQSLGFLDGGIDNGLSAHQFFISAAQQQAGTNMISFVQSLNVNYVWGVTNILLTELPPDPILSLMPGIAETGFYGNNFNGSTDLDGMVEASFDNAGQDLLLTFSGYDIDYAGEVEILLNGQSLGLLDTGVDNGLTGYQFLITAGQQQAGSNLISFVQTGDASYTWGVTDILLESLGPAMTLAIGVTETGSYGNNFNGTSDGDGVVGATFTSTGADLILTFDGFDIDAPDEVEVLLNGQSLGFTGPGIDNGLSPYEFFISAGQQQAGTNTISFVQTGNVNFTWGVTNILLTEAPPELPVALQVGTVETGIYGNHFQGVRDYDGMLDATFTGTGDDLRLRFDGFDIDFAGELEILLNGVSIGFVDAGVDNGLSPYEFVITAGQQQAGTNTISFVQTGDVNFAWGVTNIRLDALPPSFTPTDTSYAEQWHLQAIGNLERIWADYTGSGVAVGIYDDGLQHSHHDLDGNYDASKQVVVNGQSLDPESGSSQHGTAVAGVIAAEADGVGTVGVAFDASITGVNIFSGPADANKQNLSGFGEAMMQMANFDVVNNSWGWDPPFTPDSPQNDFYAHALPAIENAVVTGRGGLGTVIVKSAGNASVTSQGELLDSSRYTINVGATDNDGDIAWYSNHGANLLVTAPSSGDQIFNLGIKTTDLLGASGYSIDDYTGTDGFTGFGGTSSAAPVVSGVAALMLDANPDLGWRDVQTILAYSATHAGTAIGLAPPFYVPEDHIWRFNGAEDWNGGGLHISEDYGFGDVDAFSAVRMAEVWDLFGPAQTSANEFSVTRSDAPGIDVGTGMSFDLDLTGVSLSVDHAELTLSLSDSTVDIFLASPDGTQALLYRSGDAPAGPLDWTFGAQLFRGIDGDGVWTLDIVNADGTSAVLNDYSVSWWGRSDGVGGYSAADDVYHFTDEIFADTIYDASTGQLTSIADDLGRTTLSDADGGTDWLDMAAMTGDLDVSLADGAVGTSSGKYFLTVGAGTVVENVVGGDGNDRLTGNDFDNILMGMRSNDQLFGMGGADQLTGGAGNDELWGGLGADLFVFEDGFGFDVIEDFEATLAGTGTADLIDFRSLGEATDFAAVTGALTQTAQGAVYDFGADGLNVLTFAGLSITDLSADDFLFF